MSIFYSPKLVDTNVQYYCVKIKRKTSDYSILLDNETAYLTDYTAIQYVSLNKFVFNLFISGCE